MHTQCRHHLVRAAQCSHCTQYSCREHPRTMRGYLHWPLDWEMQHSSRIIAHDLYPMAPVLKSSYCCHDELGQHVCPLSLTQGFSFTGALLCIDHAWGGLAPAHPCG